MSSMRPTYVRRGGPVASFMARHSRGRPRSHRSRRDGRDERRPTAAGQPQVSRILQLALHHHGDLEASACDSGRMTTTHSSRLYPRGRTDADS